MSGLTALAVKSVKAGRHADGRGLYLLVKPSGARSWVLRVQVDGRRRDFGLGSVTDLTLSEAREKASALRKVAHAGGDPISERDRDRRPTPSFAEAARAAHAEFRVGWAPKHAAAFLTSLEAHVFPEMGKLRVDHVTAATVRDSLARIWTEKPAIARKLRQRITSTLDYAKSRGWRSEGAPDAKEIKRGLAKQRKSGHFSSMPFEVLPSFVETLRASPESVGRMALLFTILTAARNGETRSARWSHIDQEAGLWTRPMELMKTRETHVVTLNEAAITILKRIAPLAAGRRDALVFPGRAGKPLSDMSISKVMRDMDEPFTVHGFRTSFRNWAGERMPSIPFAAAEVALSHKVGDETTRAYLRTDFLELRRTLLNAWGEYCLSDDQPERPRDATQNVKLMVEIANCDTEEPRLGTAAVA
jgi:integrase